jgi:hypothetical protein
MSQHDHTPEEERKIREAALDETIAESFPASDPPSTIPNPDGDAAVPAEPPAKDASEHGSRGAAGPLDPIDPVRR